MFCNKFLAVTKRSQMYPNTTKHNETLVLGQMGWIGSVCCGKTRRDFVARTFALIAPVHPVLHRVSCSYETIPNAHKHNETHQNMRLGSNGVDQVRLLWKITTGLPGTKFCINWTSLICFATGFMQLRNDPKCTQILQIATKHRFWVQWGRLGAFVAKNPDVTSWHKILHYLLQCTPFCTEFQAVTKQSQMHTNTMKHTKTWDYGPMGWIRCVRCEKL